MSQLGVYLHSEALYSDAEAIMRRSLEIQETTYGPNHPEVVTALNNLAQLLQTTDRLSEAESMMRQALAISKTIYDHDYPDVAKLFNNIASLLYVKYQF